MLFPSSPAPYTVAERPAQTLLSQPPRSAARAVSLTALALLCVVFVLMEENPLGASTLLSASREQVFLQHEYWRAFTATLVHADLGHLAANSLFFTGLGYLLYGYFGGWAFPALSFVAGGVINLGVLSFYPPEVTLVGASGMVHFMASAWLTLYLLIDRRVSFGRRMLNAVAIALVLFVPQQLEARVSYLAHAIGFALGIPAGLALFALQRARIRRAEKMASAFSSEFPSVQLVSGDAAWRPLLDAPGSAMPGEIAE